MHEFPAAVAAILKGLLAHPTLKGVLSLGSVLMTLFAQNAPDGLVIVLLAAALAFIFDTLLGHIHAWQEDRWDRKKMAVAPIKVVVYLIATIGFGLVGLVIDTRFPDESLCWAFILAQLALSYIFVTEILSVFEHANALTGGKLDPLMTFIRTILERLRSAILTVPNLPQLDDPAPPQPPSGNEA